MMNIKFKKYSIIAIFTILTVALAVANSLIANAGLEPPIKLGDTFPVPTAHYVTGYTYTPYNGIARNYAIFSDHGTSTTNKFGVYFTDELSATNVKTITFKTTPGCSTSMKEMSGKVKSELTITVTGLSPIIYKGATDICKKHVLTTGVSSKDVSAGMYKVIVTVAITYPKDKLIYNKLTYPIHNDDRSLNFYISSPGSLIGNVDAGSTQNNGVFYEPRTNYYFATSKFSFGLACSADFSHEKKVTLYDADNNIEGQQTTFVRFRIYEDGIALEKESYLNGANKGMALEKYYPDDLAETYKVNFGSDDPYGTYLQPTRGGKGVNSYVYIKMKKGSRYILKVWNIFHAGEGSSYASNYIGVGVPGDSIYGTSDYSCNHWNLLPKLKLDTDSIDAGTPIKVTSTIANSGESSSGSTEWRLDRKVDSGTITTIAPLDSTERIVVKPDIDWIKDYIDSDTNFSAGANICYTLYVRPPSDLISDWAHSDEVCAMIGKRPKVQIWGGDLVSDGKVSSKTTKINLAGVDHTLGSWVEYGIFAQGIIKNTASGSAFSGTGLNSDLVCDYSVLSFTNSGDSNNCVSSQTNGGVIGNYTNGRINLDVEANFPDTGHNLSGSVNPNDSVSGTYNATNLTLTSSVFSPGKSIIIKATGTVTIAGNQTYNSNNNGNNYTKVSQLPQLVIIANKIVINSNVDRVDAWLVAKNDDKTGSIETCDVVGNKVDVCSNQLVVNGPVMTNKLYLYRTAGSEAADKGKAAEVFNLRADAYLWAFSRASTSGRIQTVYTNELPPRF